MADLKAAAKHFKIPYEDDSDFLKNAPMYHVLAAQALEAWAWYAKEGMPIEIGKNGCRILARDADGHLKYYYADTPLGAVLAAMEGEQIMSDYKPTVEQFLQDVKDHQLTIKIDQGVYRHLVCANKNGSWNHRFEIITAPHTLLIRGDMGAVAFSRVEDMFTFFSSDPDRINPSYWGEKIEGLQYDGTRHGYKFDWEHFRDTLVDSLDGYGISEDEKAKIIERMDYEIEWSDDESHVRRQVEDFVEVDGGFKFQDTWEIDAVKPLYRYIWLCRAICWAIREYRKTKEAVNG